VSESGTGNVAERIACLEQQDQRLTRALELLAQREVAREEKTRKNWDAYAAVIASFVGLLALAISSYTAYVQRKQLLAQVWPHLMTAYSGVNLTMWVTNQSTGPAQITAVRMVVDGAAVRTWSDVKRAAGFTDGEGLLISSLTGTVLPPGKEVTFVQPADNEQSRAKFKELLPRGKHEVEVTICYCSVLDDCWTAGAVDDEARPRDSCQIAARDRFTQ